MPSRTRSSVNLARLRLTDVMKSLAEATKDALGVLDHLEGALANEAMEETQRQQAEASRIRVEREEQHSERRRKRVQLKELHRRASRRKP